MKTINLSNHRTVVADYLVQFDDDDWLPGKWKNLSMYPGTLNSVILHLIPFTYYQFRVLAINGIGMSRPSRPSMRFQSSGARASDRAFSHLTVRMTDHQMLNNMLMGPTFKHDVLPCMQKNAIMQMTGCQLYL